MKVHSPYKSLLEILVHKNRTLFPSYRHMDVKTIKDNYSMSTGKGKGVGTHEYMPFNILHMSMRTAGRKHVKQREKQ